MIICKLYLIIFTIIFTSCSAQNSKINTEFNNDFISSRKSFVGKLNSEEYKKIRSEILKELATEIPDNKSILINYYQYGANCHQYGLNEKNTLATIKNSIHISSKISKKYNTKDFFVYSSKALIKDRIKDQSNFIPDSGYFDEYIFTLKENCNAFFILKTNSEFMLRYDSDYFSEVQDFLEK